ncbi:hypothetical protein AMTR_s00053p00200540 [Amborella trichopoda]|uniref:Uncharacterized protein n=1 Tax=Amborella trichopoda TaxID=13333 RepID=W1PC30_AMBTC|nr:hypothetical protein AMTR_s00053p00200540 [Amborella trichopoda]
MRGLGSGDLWSGVSATRNATKLLSFLTAYLLTKVPLMPCLRVLGRVLAAIGATLEPSLLKMLLSQVILSLSALSRILVLLIPSGMLGLRTRLRLGEWFKISGWFAWDISTYS